jgi:hypothetical protein
VSGERLGKTRGVEMGETRENDGKIVRIIEDQKVLTSEIGRLQ